jgi:transaldolase / glucose-6-phosphate isomerase
MREGNALNKSTHPLGNPLTAVLGFGQSIWYDNIRRSLLTSGELDRMIVEDGLRGVTSNPAIFEKAITGSTDYVDAIQGLAGSGLDAKGLFERLAISDIQDAADALRPVYDESDRRDGYVSLEVAPALAHNTEGTIAEAVRLWEAVGRENLMIKVPATTAGIPAVRALIAKGINVNVTLLFSTAAYEQVAEAYLAGLEEYAGAGGDVSRVASVASFFISRIDSAVDAELANRPERLAQHLQGKVAIANAKLTYRRFAELFSGPRWDALDAAGAQKQRLLWASTGTKNPAYSDVLYVEELIGPDTVNTIPPVTYDAFRDHGRLRSTLALGLEDAQDTMESLAGLGVDFEAITHRLLDEGVRLFVEAFDSLIAAVEKTAATAPADKQTLSLPADLRTEVDAVVADWGAQEKVRRLWARDASIWTGGDEARWLGWLGIVDDQLAHGDFLRMIRDHAREAGFSHALLLGMGGSSLAPEMLKVTWGSQAGYPELHVLDSTDPAQVQALERAVDLANTIFIVSSKSGSTLEPNIFKQYFFERVRQVVGDEEAGRRFIAITDPGSKVESIAAADGFRHITHGVPEIGGRYSALSNFGIVPGAIMGVDVHALLDDAERMAQSCRPSVPPAENPGLLLGAALGVCALQGRDKLTLVTSPRIYDFGAWLEQLIAESTGKQGKGIIPVDREPVGDPSVYGDDRLFVYVRLDSEAQAEQDAAVDALEAAGHPVVRISIADVYDLGGEIFRWEFATAVAGSVLGINPFDQPDVEASKLATRKLTTEYERTGSLPPEEPIWQRNGVRLFTDETNAAELHGSTLAEYLRSHLMRIGAGDYAALLAYVEMTPEHEALLTGIRELIRDRTKAATVVGFGPRFLHSTGQAYKGGPNSGVFLQITCDDAADLAVPGQTYTFGVVKAAQARGDFEVLAERGRRALRIHLGADISAGLAELREAIETALA